MLIERYSDEGFEPQLQRLLIDDVEYHKRPWEDNLELYWPDYDPEEPFIQMTKRRYFEERPFYLENEKYLRKGIWAFPAGKYDRFYLNHLKGEPRKNIAELDDNAICLLPSSQFIGRAINFLSYPEMFIPEQSLKYLKIIE